MEVQPPQSVQINFNNKIITLHNVTIVKNPKIITIDATQYSNFLKGSPVKLNNAATNATPVKFHLPSLTPVKKPQIITGNVSFKTSPTLIKPIVLNQTPTVSQVPTQVIRTIQPKNGVVQLKSSPNLVTTMSNDQIQAFLKQPQQQTVIISPPKVSINNSPVKVQFKPATTPTYVIAKSQAAPNPAPAIIKPTQAKVIISPPQKNKTSPCDITPPDAKRPCNKFDFRCIFCKNVYDDSNLLVKHLKLKHSELIKDGSMAPEQVKEPIKEIPKTSIEAEKPSELTVVVEPPADVKLPAVSLTSPTMIDNSPAATVSSPATIKSPAAHVTSPVKAKPPAEIKSPEEVKLPAPIETPAQPLFQNDVKMSENEDFDDGDDDESEVNDLIMDLEETQDTVESSQARTDTPESPEFEQHVPLIVVKKEIEEPADEAMNDPTDEDLDDEDYEYYSSMLEPICELSCEDDSNDGIQNENAAMRLYREAMEVNYQQNGIKKRGRRRQRKPKPLVENTTSLNGILAGLLENTSPSIKVPPGPGRGRRKEMNVLELEMDRSNGVCLFSCNKCDASYKYAGDLAKHVRSHTISSPYQCSICQRKFTHIGSLNTHLRIHSGERPYKCNQCDKSFTQSNSLMVHVKSHLSNKPFQCLQCNKGFLNASSLALHSKTHTGPTNPIICPIDSCGKEFRDDNLLEEHMMTHRQSMLYQCSLCSEKFEQSCLLVQHVKSHIGDKPFQCNQCGKCFTQPGSLNTHLRIHTGEKPFECNICGKKFTQASSLSVHMKVHGEKEFKCVIESCNKSYSQEAYLKKHMMKHIEASLSDENNHFSQE